MPSVFTIENSCEVMEKLKGTSNTQSNKLSKEYLTWRMMKITTKSTVVNI